MRILVAGLVAVTSGSTLAFSPTPVANRVAFSTRAAENVFPIHKAKALGMASDAEDRGGNLFQSLLDNVFQKEDVAPAEEEPALPDVTVDPDFALAAVFAAFGAFVAVLSGSIFGLVFGGLNIIFGSFLAVQTARVRFFFDKDAFELKNIDFGADAALTESGENFVVGGANRWPYDKFVNWEFFPNVDIPILVYFKETQTPEDQWGIGPGQFDEVGGGQLHFFPCIGNAKQLEEQFTIRGCAKK